MYVTGDKEIAKQATAEIERVLSSLTPIEQGDHLHTMTRHHVYLCAGEDIDIALGMHRARGIARHNIPAAVRIPGTNVWKERYQAM